LNSAAATVVIFAAPAKAVGQDAYHDVVAVAQLTVHDEPTPRETGLYIAVGGCIATLV
jgi:hypothetical protein